MAVHGYPRATVDIDMLILSDDVQSAIEEAVNIGYDLKAGSILLGKGTIHIQRVTKIDTTDGDTLWINFLLVSEPLKEIWNNRVAMIWQDRDVTVLSKQGLIKLKSIRSSKQDLADIDFLKK